MGVIELLQWFGKGLVPAPIRIAATVISFTLPGSFYGDVKPILYSFRVLGRLPVSITDKSLEKCSIISWPWLYTIVILSVQVVITLIGMHYMFARMNESKDYDEYLFWLMMILILLLNLFVPFTYWSDSSSLTAYLQQWSQFQNEFFGFSKDPLSKLEFFEEDIKAGSKSYILWMTLFNFPFVLGVTIVEIYFCVELPLIVAFPYVVIFSAIFNSSLIWCCTCRQIMRIADVLLIKTMKAVKKDNVEELVWCRRCWVRLSLLTSGLGSALKNASLSNTVVMSVSFVISSYACLGAFTRSYFGKYIVGIISEIPITLTVLLLIFNYSNNVTVKVGKAFGSSLLSIDLSHLSPRSTTEINYFLQSITLSPPAIKLADYVTVDRKLMTSFASNVITYLIVLLQFRETGDRVMNENTYDIPRNASM